MKTIMTEKQREEQIQEERETKEKVIIILSGGVDSVTLLYWSKEKYDIECISFDYGQKHKKELEFAKFHCASLGIPHKIINLDFSFLSSSLLDKETDVPEGHYEDESMKSTVVPFRNGIMLSYAIGYAENIEAKFVLIGSHSGDHAIYPDCREQFTKALSMAAVEGTYNHIKVFSPFNHLKKNDIVKIGLSLKVPYAMTWSCYKGGDKHCGKCGTCSERLGSFKMNNVEDPVAYEEVKDE